MTKSTGRVIKIEPDQNIETQSAPKPHLGIFARFMRPVPSGPSQELRVTPNHDGKQGDQGATTSEVAKRVAQQSVYSSTAKGIQSAPSESSRNRAGVFKYTDKSDLGVKVDGGLQKETEEVQSNVPQEANKTDQANNIGQTEQQDERNMSAPNPSTGNSAADFQRPKDKDRSPEQLPRQEEQAGTTSENPFEDGVTEKDTETTKCDEIKDVDQSSISADDIDSLEKAHKKRGKKCKHKHSRKRSKSRGRSKSPKRRKVTQSFIPDHEREYAERSGDDEESPNTFDAEQARASIPTGCSVRHEDDQKEELKDGKKIAKSKKFKKMMSSTLKDHQLTALCWMVKREKDVLRSAEGGIIGDEMGLGKTVTSLACIAANRLPRKDRKKSAQATLVVVPNRKIANQWLEEAKKHWHEEASSLVTLYSQDSDHISKQYEKQWIVFEINYPKLRVILDEGHGITRWHGCTLNACIRIQAKHRWVLSGTPIQNKPMEFYSYASFIRCEMLGTRRIFRNEYIVEEATNDDFDTLASYLMYRRTADEKLKIPPTTHREVYVEVSREEEMICKYKEETEMPMFESEQDEDEVEDIQPEEEDLDQNAKETCTRSIQASWQLRLRQALSHPYCLERFLMGKYLSDDDLKLLASDLKSMSEKKTIIEQLEADENWKENLGQYQTGLDKLKSRKEAFMGGIFDMNEMMDLVLLQRTVNVQKCGGGACESQNLSRFKCGHLYCGQCLGDLMTQMSNLPEAERSGGIKCSTDGCGEELLFGQPVTTLAKLAFMANKDKDYLEIGRDSIKTTIQARLERSAFFIASSYGPRIAPPPSSRLTATMAVVMTWLTEAPQDKIIIFTQFIPTLKMLGYQLETLGIKFVYYSGALPKSKQEYAMNAFHNDPETLIMLSTLKSGGQSHNLTVANRVIIVDLWWNKTAERQAISRVVRMGQKKETYSVRIITKHNMDDRVIEVQTGKEATIARMLQDDGHERTEVDDERLEQIFERKECEQSGSKRRKRKDDSFGYGTRMSMSPPVDEDEENWY
ncbi:hypothetical protein TrVFT333_010437 [Trichoderma virens FT-333]|nr:hypothetical protein TrVFT333_010437 [Trichoderma virens FT-333]